jgi:hypothetical protein
MLILSFDPAKKTMGVVFLRYNENWENELENQTSISGINKCLDYFEFIYVNSLYITDPKNKISDSLRHLKETITKLNEDIIIPAIEKYKEPLTVLVELQRPDNKDSVPVYYCLLYEYSQYNVHSVGATVKNTIELDPDMSYGRFLEKYSGSYTASKKHSENNFKYYLKLYKKEHLIKGIKKVDDPADAFTQIVGWLSRQ